MIDDTLISEVRGWAQSNVVFLTLEDPNAKNKDLDEAKIDALDKQWRAERKESD